MNKYIITILTIVLSVSLQAQENIPEPDTVKEGDLRKSVIVVTDYRPSVSDANKINSLPQLEDTVSVNPDFRYSIESSPVSTAYSLKSISAARLKGEPLPPLYKAITEVGFGNYSTAFAGIKYNSIRSRKYQYGVDVYHFSQQGKAKLANDEKVPAGHSNNYVHLYGKKFVNDLILTGNMNFDRTAAKRYGYYTGDSILTSPYDTTLNKDDIRQVFYMADFKAGVETKALDSSKIHFATELNYQFTTPRANIQEHGGGINASIFKYIEEYKIAGDIEIAHYNTVGVQGDDSLIFPRKTLLNISPWAQSATNQWKATVGFTIANVWGCQQFRFYPNIAFDFNIADNILIPYVRYKGWTEVNSYRDIASENPYIYDSLMVQPTNYQNIFKGGIRGSFSKNIPFNVYASFSDINNMYFYVNEFTLTDSAQNMFSVVYDDVNILGIHAETGYKKGDKIAIMLHGDYYNYTLSNEAHAWHKPTFELSLTGEYNMQNKIIANIEAYYKGGIYAKDITTGNAVKMDDILDINMKVEYRYTKILSAFVKFNNLIASQYSMWYLYPSYRFTAMIGVNYALGKE